MDTLRLLIQQASYCTTCLQTINVLGKRKYASRSTRLCASAS